MEVFRLMDSRKSNSLCFFGILLTSKKILRHKPHTIYLFIYIYINNRQTVEEEQERILNPLYTTVQEEESPSLYNTVIPRYDHNK